MKKGSMMFHYDKSKLSDILQQKQKEKGTYDSPCMSVCNYDQASSICQTCFLMKDEKKSWKVGDIQIKTKISIKVDFRKKNNGKTE